MKYDDQNIVLIKFMIYIIIYIHSYYIFPIYTMGIGMPIKNLVYVVVIQ